MCDVQLERVTKKKQPSHVMLHIFSYSSTYFVQLVAPNSLRSFFSRHRAATGLRASFFAMNKGVNVE